MKKFIIFSILVALVIILCFVLSGLFFWGLGLLIIDVFNITYTWTFMHGLCIAILVWVLKK